MSIDWTNKLGPKPIIPQQPSDKGLRAVACSRSSMYWAWAAFVDIRRDRLHEFPSYESWIVSDDAECRSFRQGWAAMGAIMRDPNRYPDPIDSDNAQVELPPNGGSESKNGVVGG